MNIQWLIDFFITYANLMLYVAIILVVSVMGVVALVAILNRHWLKKRSTEWIEIIPPASVAKTPEATEQLFSVLHGQRAARSLKDKLLHRFPVMSFEIVSTRKDGIRYLVQVEAVRSLILQKAVAAYIPDAKVGVVERVFDTTNQVIEFKGTGHYVLPITLTPAFEQHDPLAYITSAMTKLSNDESITLQLVVKPVKLHEADKLARQIMANEDILAAVSNGGFKSISKANDIINGALTGALDLASEVYYDAATSYRSTGSSRSNVREAQVKSQIARRERPARTISTFERELMESMHKKITQPLFQVDLRVLISGEHAKSHAIAFRSALDGYSVQPYQSLKAKTKLPLVNKRRVRLATHRLPALLSKNSLVLSSSEVAGLYHFPASRISRTDNLVSSLSRTLPAPISLKQNRQFDIVIGDNIHHNTITPIGLVQAERDRHVYIIGGTGNGKTTMIKYSLIQDIQNGKGIALVDPHGDLAEELLQYIPPERVKDVVYFNPDDLEYPFALNLLELTPGLEGNDLLREKDIITESVVSIFRKIFSDDDSGGHRIEYVLRNAIHTALTVEGATLFTVLKLLQNATYRRNIVNKLDDEDLKDFWKSEMGKAGEMQKVKMSAGITAKIGRFNVNAAAKSILGQEKSTLNFEDIIDSGKILICNLSKGMLGEDVSELFGITVLAKLQLASLRRARLKQVERRPFYLYVDEFQNFATPSFVQMLSESRKYKLFMTMAEQSTSQQKDQQMVSIILANVGTVICFRTGSPNDERLLLPLFSPYIEEGEIANLPAYNFYARLSSLLSQEPLSGVTVVAENKENPAIVKAVVTYSRENYSKKPEPQKPEEKEDKKPKRASQLKSSKMSKVSERSKKQTAIIPPGG